MCTSISLWLQQYQVQNQNRGAKGKQMCKYRVLFEIIKAIEKNYETVWFFCESDFWTIGCQRNFAARNENSLAIYKKKKWATELPHKGHVRIVKTKQLLRKKVWFLKSYNLSYCSGDQWITYCQIFRISVDIINRKAKADGITSKTKY